MSEDYTQIKQPPWMVAAIDQIMAKFDDFGGPQVAEAASADVVLMTLTEPDPSVPTEVWDFTCDHCGRHTPGNIRTGHVAGRRNGRQVLIFWGACEECLALDTEGD